MDNRKLYSFAINKSGTLREAMASLNSSGKRVCVIVNRSGTIAGLVTDGDIRRAILRGKPMESPAVEIADKNPVTARLGASRESLLRAMTKAGVVTLPLIDRNGVLRGLALMQDLASVPLSSPDITGREIAAVTAVLKSQTLSIGPQVERFEALFARYIGVKYAVAVNSGTSGLHLCVRALGIRDGDEIITSPFSFIASANCALFERARPVFVDIDKKTLCMDPREIEKKITKKTKAILPVHIFGHPADMGAIMAIARKHHLAVVEDACEALGAAYRGKRVGSFGDAAVFAFYPNKQVTTSEGGMVVTNDKKIAEMCRAMRNQGRTGNGWLSHEILGYNYRLGELNAALGVVQMQRVHSILKKRERVAGYYRKALIGKPWLTLPAVGAGVAMSWFVYVVRLHAGEFSIEDRDAIIAQMNRRGISCRNYFPPIHLEPLYARMFGYRPGDYPVTESIAQTTIALPFYNHLTRRQVEYICRSLQASADAVRDERHE